MNRRLTPVAWNTLARKLRLLGFEGPYRGGRHYFMTKGEGQIRANGGD